MKSYKQYMTLRFVDVKTLSLYSAPCCIVVSQKFAVDVKTLSLYTAPYCTVVSLAETCIWVSPKTVKITVASQITRTHLQPLSTVLNWNKLLIYITTSNLLTLHTQLISQGLQPHHLYTSSKSCLTYSPEFFIFNYSSSTHGSIQTHIGLGFTWTM